MDHRQPFVRKHVHAWKVGDPKKGDRLPVIVHSWQTLVFRACECGRREAAAVDGSVIMSLPLSCVVFAEAQWKPLEAGRP